MPIVRRRRRTPRALSRFRLPGAVTTNYEELPWQICESCGGGGGGGGGQSALIETWS
jgi:hypothetical protein